MRQLVALFLLLSACGDTEITPEPTGTSSNSTTGAGAGNAGGEHEGGAGAGGVGGAVAGLGYENGSRLRARVFVGEDGSKQFLGWHDTELDIDCAFARAPNGSYRCFPTDTTFDSGIYFTDSSCNIEAVIAACEPKYITRVQAGCDGGTIVSSVGAESPTLYLKSGASCISYTAPAGYTAYARGSDINASTFAGASVEVD